MRMSVTIGLVAAFLASSASAENAVVLPPELAVMAADAGTTLSTAKLVEADGAGLIDRSDGSSLRLARAAYEAAADDGERAALLAVAMSYRVATRPRTGTASGLRDVLADVVGPTIQANVLEAQGRGGELFNSLEPSPEPAGDRASAGTSRVALRGLAWAGRLGVCEARVVRALERVAALGGRSPDASRDARSVLRGLGMIRFSPDARCPA